MKITGQFIFACIIALVLAGCNDHDADDAPPDAAEMVTPVTVTNIHTSSITDYVELNAMSVYQQRNFVKSNTTGYVEHVQVRPGQFIQKGQLLFTLKTKEAAALGNTINSLDSSFRFTGINNIRASASGYITELDHQAGDYVQDGEQLAIISDAGSFGFIMNMPYELRPYLNGKSSVDIILPDGEQLRGTIAFTMPLIDSATQNQQIFLKVNAAHSIPQNLMARVRLVKSTEPSAQLLPKAAVLSNETQTAFWVMKLINDSTAVKVPVKIGMQLNDSTQIILPDFHPQDKIILEGNYGLPDTARVTIAKALNG